MSSKKHKMRGRKDHYLPQSYLRGFIDPNRAKVDKPLWHLNLTLLEWSEKSAVEIGWEKGFYDHASGSPETFEHADVTFGRLEREFSLRRDHMLKRHFKSWATQQKPFLLEYMQMMRARSPLFLEAQSKEKSAMVGARVVGVGPGNVVQLDSLELRPLPPNVVRNSIIGTMQQEISKGADWMADFNWCLRYVRSPALSFVTGTQPLRLEAPSQFPGIEAAMSHPDTLIWFPLCWQACLVGSKLRFNKGTEEADSGLVEHVRSLFRTPTTDYLIAAQSFPL